LVLKTSKVCYYVMQIILIPPTVYHISNNYINIKYKIP